MGKLTSPITTIGRYLEPIYILEQMPSRCDCYVIWQETRLEERGHIHITLDMFLFVDTHLHVLGEDGLIGGCY